MAIGYQRRRASNTAKILAVVTQTSPIRGIFGKVCSGDMSVPESWNKTRQQTIATTQQLTPNPAVRGALVIKRVMTLPRTPPDESKK